MIHLSKKTSLHDSVIEPHSACLGVVLAGGLSSRMGKDKASLQRNQINMLTYSKQLLKGVGIKNLVISGESNSSSSHDVVVADKYKKAGPMGGIASVIEKYKPAALLIMPVDLPLITTDTLQKLKQIGELSQQACFYSANYLPLYLPVNAYTENFLNNAFIKQPELNSNNDQLTSKNGPSMRELLRQIPHKTLACDNPSTLFNTNTPEEWALAQKSFMALNRKA